MSTVALNARSRALLTVCVSRQLKLLSGARLMGHHEPLPLKLDIGKREVVGYGLNGGEFYFDHVTCPFPAIRFKEETAEIALLREKEKGDWKKLTLEEKKQLYRFSFCQTLSEKMAPVHRSDYKMHLGLLLLACSFTAWISVWMKLFGMRKPPKGLTDDDEKRRQMQLMLDMKVNRINGLASKWDYDKQEWKKSSWW